MKILHNILSLVIITSTLYASETEWVDDIATGKITNRSSRNVTINFMETKRHKEILPKFIKDFFKIPPLSEYNSTTATMLLAANTTVQIPIETTLIGIQHEHAVRCGSISFHDSNRYEVQTESSYSIMELYDPERPTLKNKPRLFINDKTGEILNLAFTPLCWNKKTRKIMDHKLEKLDPEYWTDHAKAKRETTICLRKNKRHNLH